jgi:hypothetical protein
MKIVKQILMGTALTFGCGTHDRHKTDFISERISRSETFVICADIEKVFPLFGAFEERK